jgi:hypothetical protein
MTTKEWAIPLAVGLVAGVGLWALTAGPDGGGDGSHDGGHGSETGTSTTEPVPDLLLPFAEGRGPEGRELTFLVLAPHGKAAAMAEANRSSASEAQRLVWQGDRVALYATTVPACPDAESGQGVSCDPPWAFEPWAFPKATEGGDGQQLLRGGHNATRVTAYVFDEAGELLASNANDTARYTLHDDFVRLPSTAWYLGANATAPNGTSHLPGFAKPLVDRVRPQLDGLPVGGVASVRSNAYAALYGSLFVTVRVDSLVLAP